MNQTERIIKFLDENDVSGFERFDAHGIFIPAVEDDARQYLDDVEDTIRTEAEKNIEALKECACPEDMSSLTANDFRSIFFDILSEKIEDGHADETIEEFKQMFADISLSMITRTP